MNPASTPLTDGVWGVVTTPFTGSTGQVDAASLVRLAQHYQEIGVAGLTVLGVFGEAAQLAMGERRKVLELVSGNVGLPLVVGATSLGTAPVQEEARLAVEVVGDQLAAVMVQVNSAQPDVLAAHLNAIHDVTVAPIVVQDYPLISGVPISPEALATALTDLPFIAAVKAEGPPTPVAIAALKTHLDVPIFGGLGGVGLLDELAAGSAGAMTGFSFPEGLLSCVNAWRDGGYELARTALLPYLPLINFEQQATVALAIRKECRHQRGLITDPLVRPPAARFPEALRAQLLRHVAAVQRPVETTEEFQ